MIKPKALMGYLSFYYFTFTSVNTAFFTKMDLLDRKKYI